MSYRGIYWTWIEEWSQFLRHDNWFTFRPIMVEVEDDRIMGGVEVTVIILGLGFRMRLNHTETAEVTEIKQQIADIDNGRVETKPWP